MKICSLSFFLSFFLSLNGHSQIVNTTKKGTSSSLFTTFQPKGTIFIPRFYEPDGCNLFFNGINNLNYLNNVNVHIFSEGFYDSSVTSFLPPIGEPTSDGVLWYNYAGEVGDSPTSGIEVLTYTASKTDDPLNGVSSADMYYFNAWIEEELAIDNPFLIIGGDVNNDGAVTRPLDFPNDHPLTTDLGFMSYWLLSTNPSPPAAGYWRFMHRLHLVSNPEFCNAFNENPFTAENTNLSMSYPDYCNGTMSSNTVNSAGGIGGSQWFYVIKVGDANLSYDNNGFTGDDSEERSENVITYDSVEKLEKGYAEISLNIEDLSISKSFQTGIKFDSDVLEILDVTCPTKADFSNENYSVLKDELRIVWYDNLSGQNRSMNSDDEIKIRVKLLSPIDALYDVFRLDNSVLKNLILADLVKGETLSKIKVSSKIISVNENSEATIIVFPNPTESNKPQLIYSSSLVDKGMVELVDINGKILFQNQITVDEGDNVITLELPLSFSGIAFCRLNLEHSQSSVKLIKR